MSKKILLLIFLIYRKIVIKNLKLDILIKMIKHNNLMNNLINTKIINKNPKLNIVIKMIKYIDLMKFYK